MYEKKRHTHVDNPQSVDRPHTPVSDDRGNHLDTEALAIVHVRLRRVVTENSIGMNITFTGLDRCASITCLPVNHNSLFPINVFELMI